MKEFKGFKRGVNLGGWLSQSNYEKDHLENFIKEEDFALIKSWGADHVRLPFDFNIFLDKEGKTAPDAFLYLDRAVGWCGKNGLNIVLDLHKTMGFSFDKGEQETGFFESEKYQDIFVDMWADIARHYAKYEDSVAFELLNEITELEFAQIWNGIARRTVTEIRKHAPKNYILIGGIYQNSVFGLTLLDKPYDDRIVYNFHYYNPLIFTHQKAYWVDGMPNDFELSYPGPTEEYVKASENFLGAGVAGTFKGYDKDVVDINFMEREISTAVEISRKLDVPIYCGEYGVIDVAPEADTIRWHEDIHSLFELHGIGRSMWNFRGKDFGITDEKRSAISRSLIELI